MELVYLWVEKYKNIENQGFNFSPRFKCEFKAEYDEDGKLKDNCKLEIIPKNYVSIFPENINITAIVGENGSGKSSILELLPYGEKIKEANKLIFFLFKKDNEYILLNLNSKKIEINKDFEEKVEEDISKFDFSNSNEIKRITYDTDFTKEDFIDKDIIQYFANINKYGFSFKENYLEENNKIFNIEKYKHISNIFTYILKDELEYLNIFFRPTYVKISNYDKSHTNLKINETIEKLRSKEENKKFIEQLEINKNLLEQFKYNQKIALNELDKIKILFELPIQNHFYIDFYNEKDISFSEFSQGERNFYNHFLFLMFINKNHSESKENENTFFLIDEPDTTFHPNWQKKYINQLMNIYKNYKKNIHLILTSHSPFILSDLPKENIIFLKDGKQEKPFKENEQTFGANIHTLLSHGFFMEDGLMGEFAKNKISEVIELLKKDQLSEDEIKDCKHIISIIGEPILQKTLEHQLNTKLNPNETELQKLEREQKEIQEKIAKLKRENNETN